MSHQVFRGVLFLAKGISLGFLCGVLLILLRVAGLDSRIGGDFAAFYGAGSIVLEGDRSRLYDFDYQKEIQQQKVPTLAQGEFQPFPYPPPVAAAYTPFALVPFEFAYWAQSALSLLAVLLGCRIALRVLPRSRVA